MKSLESSVKKRIVQRRYGRTCESCRIRKVRCDGIHPCLNCMDYQKKCIFQGRISDEAYQVYKDNRKIRQQMEIIKTSIKNIQDNNLINMNRMVKVLEELYNKLSSLQDKNILEFDAEKIKAYDEKHPKSLEYQLIGAEYQFFDLFNYTHDGSKIMPFYYGGIYSSSGLLIQNRNKLVVEIMKKYKISENDIKDSQLMFDKLIGILNLKYYRNLREVKTPIDRYLDSLGVQASIDRQYLMKNLIIDCAKLMKVEDDYVNRTMDIFKPEETFATIVSLLRLLGVKCSRDETITLKEYYEIDEKLTALAFEFFFRRPVFAIPNIENIQTLMEFVRMKFWEVHPYALSPIIQTVIAACKNIGLDRWEYYIDLNEKQAEEHRGTWLTCQWWDLWLSHVSGKPPLICTDITLATLPTRFSVLEISNNTELDELVYDSNIENLSRDDRTELGYIIVGRLIYYANINLLYNERFTNIKVFAFNNQSVTTTLLEVIKKMMKIRSLFQISLAKLLPSIEIIDNNDYDTVKFFFNFMQAFFNILFYMEQLLKRWRISIGPKDKLQVDKQIKQFKSDKNFLLMSQLRKFSTINTTSGFIQFSNIISKCLECISFGFLEDPFEDSWNKVLLIAKCSSILLNLQGYSILEPSKNKINVKNGSEDRVLLHIYILKFVLQIFIASGQSTAEELLTRLKQEGQLVELYAREALEANAKDIIHHYEHAETSVEILTSSETYRFKKTIHNLNEMLQ